MGNNMIPYAIMIGEKYTFFIAHHYKFLENDKIEEGTLLISTNGYPYDYHVEKYGENSFKKLEYSLIHTCRVGYGENEDAGLFEENEDNIQEDVNIHELE